MLRAAVDLVDEGCNIIFADSFGHEPYMIEAAKENPEVQFCHSTGTRAHTEGLANYHNAFASIYEGRYLAGIAAGMKLNEMIEAGEIKAEEAKMGYVGAFTYAEVVSGYTSFYLGAKSVCPTVTMEVTFTGSWYDEALEKEGAEQLIAAAASSSASTPTLWVLLPPARTPAFPTSPTTAPPRLPAPTPTSSPPASTGRPTMSMPSRLSWTAPTIDADWTGTLATDSVVLTELNTTLPPRALPRPLPLPPRSWRRASSARVRWHLHLPRRLPEGRC